MLHKQNYTVSMGGNAIHVFYYEKYVFWIVRLLYVMFYFVLETKT